MNSNRYVALQQQFEEEARAKREYRREIELKEMYAKGLLAKAKSTPGELDAENKLQDATNERLLMREIEGIGCDV